MCDSARERSVLFGKAYFTKDGKVGGAAGNVMEDEDDLNHFPLLILQRQIKHSLSLSYLHILKPSVE